MALTEYPALSNLQNVTSSFSRPAVIDYSTIENGHPALTNSTSNSSTASNASAYSISSHLMNENACPKLPKSFTSQETHPASKPSSLSDHQCLKPGLLKHPLLYPHTASPANHLHSSSPHTHSPHAHSPHSPLSPLAHFSHQHLHHHLHHLQQQNRGNLRATAADLLNGGQPAASQQPATNQSLQFKPLCRTQNINSFARLSDALHRKIEYTGSGSSLASSSTSGCVSASSSAHHFPLSPLSNSSICSPSSGPSSGPQTPQSGYVQSPLAQSFTTDSGLCLAYRGIQPANNGNPTDLSGDGQPTKHRIDRSDRKYETPTAGNANATDADLKLINKTAVKRTDASKKAGAKLIDQKAAAAASFLNLPSQKKDTDDESLLSDYSKGELCGSGGNLGSISATSTTNLVSATTGNSANLHAAITSKPSLPGTSSSFFHYPNIYNPLKNSRNSTKNNKKLIRFFTVCAYVLCVSLVAILLSFYYLFLWNPYKSAEEPVSIEQFGLTSINGRSLNGATVNSLANSEELDGGTINGGSSIGGRPPNGGRPALALKRSVVNDKSALSSASTSSSFRNSMMDSDQTDSGENSNNYKPKFVNLLQQSATKVKAGGV